MLIGSARNCTKQEVYVTRQEVYKSATNISGTWRHQCSSYHNDMKASKQSSIREVDKLAKMEMVHPLRNMNVLSKFHDNKAIKV